MANRKPAQTKTSTRAKTLASVVKALSRAPETLNPCTQLYHELHLEYAFGRLDLGALVLNKGALEKTIEAGKAEQETVQAMLKRLKKLPSRSSLYVPL